MMLEPTTYGHYLGNAYNCGLKHCCKAKPHWSVTTMNALGLDFAIEPLKISRKWQKEK